MVTIGALGKSYLERHLPLLEQLALIDFINDGHLEKHLKTTQKALAQRRQSLVLAITRYLKDLVEPLSDGGGTHFILNFHPEVSDQAIDQAAHKSGFNLMSTKPYYASATQNGQYIVPFASVDQSTIDNVVKTFATELKNHSGQDCDAN